MRDLKNSIKHLAAFGLLSLLFACAPDPSPQVVDEEAAIVSGDMQCETQKASQRNSTARQIFFTRDVLPILEIDPQAAGITAQPSPYECTKCHIWMRESDRVKSQFDTIMGRIAGFGVIDSISTYVENENASMPRAFQAELPHVSQADINILLDWRDGGFVKDLEDYKSRKKNADCP